MRHPIRDDPGCTRGLRQRVRVLSGREDGQAIVEIAISLPLLLLILTAILQFGLMLNKAITLNDAVRTGARTLAIDGGGTISDPCDSAITATVNSATNVGLTSGQVSVTLPSGDTCGTGTYPNRTGATTNAGDTGTVTATYPYSFTVFGMPLFNINLNASASDAIE
jgi:Flp pilus assembly protein TadG